MKKVIIIFSLLISLALPSGVATADIQAPPASRYGQARKLGRAINNLLFFIQEIPMEWQKTLDSDGNTAAASYGMVNGFKKSGVRIGYGLYELITWPFATHKGGYNPPYYESLRMNPFDGYSEFSPQIGIIADKHYGREQVD